MPPGSHPRTRQQRVDVDAVRDGGATGDRAVRLGGPVRTRAAVLRAVCSGGGVVRTLPSLALHCVACCTRYNCN